jgi:hypothetical protein
MQKKILLAAFIGLIVATQSNAQIKKGAILLGGQLGFSYSDNNSGVGDDTKTTSFNFSPAVGKAIKENLVIGVDLNFVAGSSKTGSSSQTSPKTYGAGFFARQYKNLGKGFYFFGQGRAGFNYNQTTSTYNNTIPPVSQNYTGYNIGLTVYPGVSYAVSNKFQLEMALNNLAYLQYTHSKQTETYNPDIKSDNFQLGSSLSSLSGLVIGFRFLLN